MKTLILIAVTAAASLGKPVPNAPFATCKGKADCRACKNCHYGKHCNQDKGHFVTL